MALCFAHITFGVLILVKPAGLIRIQKIDKWVEQTFAFNL